MKVEGALPNFSFCSCPNGAYKQSFGKSIGSVLKLSLGEVRELSSGSKKFLQSTEFTLVSTISPAKLTWNFLLHVYCTGNLNSHDRINYLMLLNFPD